MGRRKKLEKFADLNTFASVLQYPLAMAGQWTAWFGNTQPIVLELGCGKGDYSLALASQHPEKNYIGIDIQGERLWYGARAADQAQLNNMAWLRLPIEQLNEQFLAGEVAELWLTFPDPFPRDRQAKKRLTSPRFLQMYKTILQPDGVMHLKTDSAELFDYSVAMVTADNGYILAAVSDVYRDQPVPSELAITTTFERRHLAAGKTIHYLAWQW
ncbi:MAG: tRNA (guanosine(46)-N7)-methyltransferase TrmB [Candidatus Kerfeldbacteria bacterium]|nr:tRNA (guanosine(46)-N7)-methyltransferase TrmB [Candidatus Kerfeldbacteria bacterium]